MRVWPQLFASHQSQPQRGVGGEIQPTDAIEQLTRIEKVFAQRYEGSHYDCGSKPGLLQACTDLAECHSEVGAAFSAWLRHRQHPASSRTRATPDCKDIYLDTYTLQHVIELLSGMTGHTMNVRVNPSFVRANEVSRLFGCPSKLLICGEILPEFDLQETLHWMISSAFKNTNLESDDVLCLPHSKKQLKSLE